MRKLFILMSIVNLFCVNIFAQFQEARDYLDRGITLFEENRYQDAISNLNTAIEKSNKIIEEGPEKNFILKTAHLYLAQIHIKWGQYSDAVEDCNDALSIDPNYYIALRYRGIAHFYNSSFQLAAQDLERINTLGILDDDTRIYLGRAYLENHEYEKAKTFLSRVNTFRGRELYNRACTLYVEEIIDTVLIKAQEFQDENNWKRAIDQYERALNIAVENEIEYKPARLMINQMKNNWIAELKAYLEINPDDTESQYLLFDLFTDDEDVNMYRHYYRGLSYMQNNNWSVAYEDFEKSLSINPGFEIAIKAKDSCIDGWIKDTEGKLLYNPNDKELRDLLEDILMKKGLETKYVEVYYDALARYKNGEWESAIENFRETLEMQPDNRNAESLLEISIENAIRELITELDKHPDNYAFRLKLNNLMKEEGINEIVVDGYYDSVVLFEQGKWEMARSQFQSVENLDNKYLTNSKFKMLITKQKKSLLQQIQKEQSDDRINQLRFELAKLYAFNKENKLAIRTFKNVVQIDESYLVGEFVLDTDANIQDYIDLSKIYLDMNREDKIQTKLQSLKDVKDISENDLLNLLFIIGIIYSRNPETEMDAKKMFINIIRKDHNYEGIYFKKDNDVVAHYLFAYSCKVILDSLVVHKPDTLITQVLNEKAIYHCNQCLRLDESYQKANRLLSRLTLIDKYMVKFVEA